MAESKDATPQPRRRLGLRRLKGANSTPGIRGQLNWKTPLSEGRAETNTVETPRGLPGKLKANSTNCRRPGLSRIRKDISKKRLEFVDTIEKAPEKEDVKKTEGSSNWRERQILELEADIETWRNGFIAAMDDLQGLVMPRVGKEQLLTQLGIPLEMLQYLDED